MVDLNDTICALSSARGRSGIAVVRLSGPRCFEIAGRLFLASGSRQEIPERHAALGRVIDRDTGLELDEALLLKFCAPHSYTGEDVAEISVHGSPVVVSRLLECLCAQGARLAEPGEFTLRAFLNGRIDLAQAEAVRDVIEAHTLYQLQVAGRQRCGELSRRLEPVKREIIEIIADLETAVEFAEEDLELEPRGRVESRIERVEEEIRRWADTYRRGRIVHDGFSLAIVGRPNVGKSSLFNALLDQDRSIVTEWPGTTRDLVSEFANIEGIPVRLIDTAGLREGEDRIEQMGVDRSLRAIADADAVLLVLDPSQPWCAEDEKQLEKLRPLSCIVAFNKRDLAGKWTMEQRAQSCGGWASAEVSARTGENVPELRRLIQRHLFGEGVDERDGLLVTNLRHSRCLEAARQQLVAAAGAMRSGLSEEFVLVDLHKGLRQLGEITGETSAEEILSEIFSRFCIGK